MELKDKYEVIEILSGTAEIILDGIESCILSSTILLLFSMIILDGIESLNPASTIVGGIEMIILDGIESPFT